MAVCCLLAAVVCVGAGAYQAPDHQGRGALLLALALLFSTGSAVFYVSGG